MSIKAMTNVWEHAPFDSGTLLVLLALADYADDKGWAWPSVSTLAWKSRMSERNVQRAIARLVADEWLTVDLRGGPHYVNRYRVHEYDPSLDDPRQIVTGDIRVSKMSPDPSDPISLDPIRSDPVSIRDPDLKIPPTSERGGVRGIA